MSAANPALSNRLLERQLFMPFVFFMVKNRHFPALLPGYSTHGGRDFTVGELRANRHA